MDTNGIRDVLRASALFYAVTMALLIATVTSSMILLAHFRNMETERWIAHERVRSNTSSAIRQQASAGMVPAFTQADVDLFGAGGDSVHITAQPYGLLDLVRAYARIADQHAQLSAFVGGRARDAHVLTVGTGSTDAVQLCGDARLLGDVVVPNAEVKRGYVNGHAFSGGKLVEGNVTASSGPCPGPDNVMMERLVANCRRVQSPEEHAVLLSSTDDSGDEGGIPMIDLTGIPVLSGIERQGPLILRSEDTLEIAADCILDMVIIQAPFIRIAPSAVLSVQCFAERGMEIGEGARLVYPSALVLVPNVADHGSGAIMLGEDAQVEGAIIACHTDGDAAVRTLVSTAQGSLVHGEVLAMDMLEHHGTVRGTAYAGALLLRTASSTYEGYLMDGVFAPCAKNVMMGGAVTGTDRKWEVIKWQEAKEPVRKAA